jgi:hypothetical protein
MASEDFFEGRHDCIYIQYTILAGKGAAVAARQRPAGRPTPAPRRLHTHFP